MDQSTNGNLVGNIMFGFDTILVLMFWFTTKHFVADFLLQPAFMHQNKGTYGHVGGIAHAVVHVWMTTIILMFLGTNPVLFVSIIAAEFVVHYHIDWAKMNINKKMGWGANTHAEFWYLTGFDQYLHALTYIVIIGYAL